MTESSRIRRPERKSKGEILKVWGPLLVLVAIGFAIAFAKLEPPAPTSFKIAAGSPGGAYHAYAERYRTILKRQGFELEVVETAGSVENLDLVRSGAVDLALLQGGAGPPGGGQMEQDPGGVQTEGVATGEQTEHLGQPDSLASLFYEPVWLFFRSDRPVEQLTDLAGRRIAIGPAGSGTQTLARQLLADNGIDDAGAELLPLSSMEAAAALRSPRRGANGSQATVDAAFFVTSPDSSYLVDLVAGDGIELLSVRRSLAYRKAHPFLSRVILGEGVFDIERNLPEEDISLLAAAASLVGRPGLHHALVPLLLGAMEEVHGGIGRLTAAGTFPSQLYVDFPLRAEAKHYLENGPSFLQRYLGFRAATAIDRLKILLLPLITLLIPVFKAGPPIYRWRIRSKIYRWYEDLSWADEILHEQPTDEEVAVHLGELQKLEQEVAQVSVPLSYMDEYYSLRVHIQLILSKLEGLASERGLEFGALAGGADEEDGAGSRQT